jgi:hypothetical protein
MDEPRQEAYWRGVAVPAEAGFSPREHDESCPYWTMAHW